MVTSWLRRLAAPGCAGKGAGVALEIREHAVTAFGLEAGQRGIEEALVIHAG